MATKLVSMKRTKDDKRKDMGSPAEVTSIAPDYPWGLCIHLEADELAKLGMKEMPTVGTEMPITAVVKVTRVSQSAVEGSDDQKSVDLQVTSLGIGG